MAGVEPLLQLRELYADHNGLESMAPLAALTELHTLELSNNRLQAVACASLVSLEELWLNDNPIEAETHLADLAALPRLQTLYLASLIPPPHPTPPTLRPHPPYHEGGLTHYPRTSLTPPYLSLHSRIHLLTLPYALLARTLLTSPPGGIAHQ